MTEYHLFMKWGNYALRFANDGYSGVYENMKEAIFKK